jgi:antitoxin ParD1/3/4
MSVKTSVSISEQQDQYARQLVEDGRYSSLSAVVQRGLELVRAETELKDAEIAALKTLIAERSKGEFVSLEEGRERTKALMAAKRVRHGL